MQNNKRTLLMTALFLALGLVYLGATELLGLGKPDEPPAEPAGQSAGQETPDRKSVV